MTLMDLPLEMFRAVLAETMLSRGFKRALRLRLIDSKHAIPVINTPSKPIWTKHDSRFFRTK